MSALVYIGGGILVGVVLALLLARWAIRGTIANIIGRGLGW